MYETVLEFDAYGHESRVDVRSGGEADGETSQRARLALDVHLSDHGRRRRIERPDLQPIEALPVAKDFHRERIHETEFVPSEGIVGERMGGVPDLVPFSDLNPVTVVVDDEREMVHVIVEPGRKPFRLTASHDLLHRTETLSPVKIERDLVRPDRLLSLATTEVRDEVNVTLGVQVETAERAVSPGMAPGVDRGFHEFDRADIVPLRWFVAFLTRE